MSARSFRSVGWVAGVAATALGCYMVNLKVASERAALEDVETRIVLAERDIRLLQTEIGTRGRLAQLEKWNVKVLALSAPAANQFMDGSFQLATLMAPQKVPDPAAPVVLASAAVPERQPVLASDGPSVAPQGTATAASLLHTASLKRETVPAPVAAAPQLVAKKAGKPRSSVQPEKAVAAPAKPVKVAAKPAIKPASDLPTKAGSKPAKTAVKAKPPSPKPVKTAAAPAKPVAKAKAKTQEAQAKQ
ncbi:hypothetical protein [uncultured Sphingomonas sp.]|uniref:hypothetical protein n=1 Tax=uncultured Sphingomonas sp. TaxID=158754 RepID=UPI0025E8434A|nr:hypothetical protein [uncultured Sphingomonas sp.]